MKRVGVILTTLALLIGASLVLVSTTAAGTAASKQRIVIETKTAAATFVLTPQGSGPLKADSGKFAYTGSTKEIVRHGQSVKILTATFTFTGKQGAMVLRQRFDDVAAGAGYRVATGTWSLISTRGTGQYAKVSGSGGSAYAATPQQRLFLQFEGLVR